MIFRPFAALLALGVVLFAGCASGPGPAQTTTAAGEAVGTNGAVAPGTNAAMTTTTRPAAGAPKTAEPAQQRHTSPPAAGAKTVATVESTLQPGEYALLVTSDQPGAMVVLNGKPSGKTPCSVIVQANARGFLRERVSIKVRFIASDEGGLSQTVEDVLTTLDRVPMEIRFTANGTTRVVR